MELEKFIIDFSELFEDTDTSSFSEKTNFKDLEEWSSLQMLLVIGLADEKYNVRIKGDDISGVFTIGDLYALLKSKKR